MHIDRCVCLGRSFADLLDEARREGLSLDDLMRQPRRGRGDRCGLCRPYLREALRSGQTVFHEVQTDPAPQDP